MPNATHPKNDNRGVSLILTIIILTSVLAAIITLSVLIVNELKYARNINHSIVAYYGAESGIEKGLYDITQARIQSLVLGDETIGVIADLKDNSGSFNAAGESGASWNTAETGRSSIPMFVSEIPQDQSAQYNLFDPDTLEDPVGIPTEPGILFADVDWDWPDSPNVGASLEFTVFELDGTTGERCEAVAKRVWVMEEMAIGTPPMDDIELDVDEYLPATCAIPTDQDIYQIRVKALKDDIYNFRLNVEDQNHSDIDVQSGIELKSVGSFSKSEKAIRIQVPWKLAASGFLDYVIFAEEELYKLRD
ncbi:MAG: hypothetical protein ABIB97_05480 [Patescibacteria group bacterium]